jgi:hypothetical protein
LVREKDLVDAIGDVVRKTRDRVKRIVWLKILDSCQSESECVNDPVLDRVGDAVKVFVRWKLRVFVIRLDGDIKILFE